MNEDERPDEEAAPGPASERAASGAEPAEQPQEPQAAEQPAPGLSPRRPPLRGTGAGLGMAGEGGGASRLIRRVQEAAELARRAAEQHRPAAERAVHEAAERARQAVEAAKPEVERLAQQARAAVEAARPHVERAADEAATFAREHDDELRSAAARAARAVTPQPLRPALDAMQEELQKRPPAAPEDEERPPAP